MGKKKIISNVLSRIPILVLFCYLVWEKVWMALLGGILIIAYSVYEMVVTYKMKRHKFNYVVYALLIAFSFYMMIFAGKHGG